MHQRFTSHTYDVCSKSETGYCMIAAQSFNACAYCLYFNKDASKEQLYGSTYVLRKYTVGKEM